MQVTFKGEDLYWLIAFEIFGSLALLYCTAKIGNWLGWKIVRLVEGKKLPKQLSLFIALIVVSTITGCADRYECNSPRSPGRIRMLAEQICYSVLDKRGDGSVVADDFSKCVLRADAKITIDGG